MVSSRFIFALAFFACASFSSPSLGQKQYQTLEGERDDNHGNIIWKSNVTHAGTDWTYLHEVKNRDANRNCYVNWETVEFQGLLPPKFEKPIIGGKHDVGPKEAIGQIRYNGGVSPGEGSALAKAWRTKVAVEAEERSSEAFANLFIEVKKTIYAVEIRATSKVEKTGVSYHLIVKPMDFEQGGFSHDVRDLLVKTRVEWESVRSEAWQAMQPIEFLYGWMEDGKHINFERSKEGATTYEFKVVLPTQGETVFRDKAIRFDIVDDSGKRVTVAKANLPAYAPAK